MAKALKTFFQSMKCAVGLHNWTKWDYCRWGDIVFWEQYRDCLNCGEHQRKDGSTWSQGDD